MDFTETARRIVGQALYETARRFDAEQLAKWETTNLGEFLNDKEFLEFLAKVFVAVSNTGTDTKTLAFIYEREPLSLRRNQPVMLIGFLEPVLRLGDFIARFEAGDQDAIAELEQLARDFCCPCIQGYRQA